MTDVQAFVMTSTEVSAYIGSSPTLEATYGARLTNTRSLLAQAQEHTELGRLVNYLQTLPYSHWSYFLNNASNLLASHKLFTAHKDAFVAIATLMQEAQDYPTAHAYVLTKFPDQSQKQKPYIKLEEI